MPQIPGYALAATFISLGGILNGFDTGSIGAVTEMASFHSTFGHLSPSLRGFTVSLIMLTGALPSFFAGQVIERFGRLRVVAAGAAVFLLGAIMQGAASELALFLVGRALCGVGEGLFMSNVSVYITEIAPSRQRGMYVSMPQFCAAVGVCAGYFTCYGSVHLHNSMAWRTPFVVMAAVAAIMAGGCAFLPESPRWLVLHGRREKALKELERLDFSKEEAEKDVLRPAERAAGEVGLWEGMRMIFQRQYRSRTTLGLFVLGMVQLSGIDGVLYYAPTLFAQAGIPSQTSSFLASGVSAILMLAISIPAFLYADRWGRRTSAISGGLTLSSCMLLIGSLYAARVVHPYGAARWVVIVCIFVFALTFCLTWGITGKIYASEIQPAHTRATANSLAQGLSFFANFLVAIITPILLSKSAFGAYFLFGFLALGTVAVLAVYMSETRGQSLENIQETFRRPAFRSWAHLLRRVTSSPHSSVVEHDRAIVGHSESVELDSFQRVSEEDAAASGTLHSISGRITVLHTA